MKIRHLAQRLLPLFLILLSITHTSLFAQSTTGSIYGTAVDSTGAAIPNALVTVKETRTGATQTQKTNGGNITGMQSGLQL